METIFKYLFVPIILFLNIGCLNFPPTEDYGDSDVNMLSMLLETDNATLINWYIGIHDGINIDLPGKYTKKTLLEVAIEAGKYHAVQALLESGANPNGGGALCAAVREGTTISCKDVDNSRFVSLLLDHGANPNATDRHGALPVSIKRETRDISCLKCLVEKGRADVKRRLQWNDSAKVSLLDIAYLRCRLDIMWYLVSKADMGDWLDSVCWDGENNIMHYLRPEICTYDKNNEKYRKRLWKYYNKQRRSCISRDTPQSHSSKF